MVRIKKSPRLLLVQAALRHNLGWESFKCETAEKKDREIIVGKLGTHHNLKKLVLVEFEVNMGGTSKPYRRGPTHQAYSALWWPFSIFRRTHSWWVTHHYFFLFFVGHRDKSWPKTWRLQCCCGFEARPWKSRGLLTSRGRFHKISNHLRSISQTLQGIAFQVKDCKGCQVSVMSPLFLSWI